MRFKTFITLVESIANGIIDFEVEDEKHRGERFMGKNVKDVPPYFLQWAVKNLPDYVRWTQTLKDKRKRITQDPAPWMALFTKELARRGLPMTPDKSGWKPGDPSQHPETTPADPHEADRNAYAREAGLKWLKDENVIKINTREFQNFKRTVESGNKTDGNSPLFMTSYAGFAAVAPFDGYDGWMCYFNAHYGRCIIERWEENTPLEKTETMKAVKSAEELQGKSDQGPGNKKAADLEDKVFKSKEDGDKFDELIEKWVEAKASWQHNKADSLYHNIIMRAEQLHAARDSAKLY